MPGENVATKQPWLSLPNSLVSLSQGELKHLQIVLEQIMAESDFGFTSWTLLIDLTTNWASCTS